MKLSHVESIRSLAVVGATGMVGKEFLSLLSEHRIATPQLKLLASQQSVGEAVEVLEREVSVEQLTPEAFDGVEVAFFSVPGEVTRKYVPEAVKRGCVVIDDSSVYRMQAEVPLIIPEVNGSLLRDFQGQIISTPNCVAAPLALALKPLADQYGLKRVVVSTYQSVSGAGRAAYNELSSQAVSLLNGMPAQPAVFPHQIAFNSLPQIGPVLENGYCDEEDKLIKETRKILDLPELKITASTVRIPTFYGHGLSVNVELAKPFDSIEAIREAIDDMDGAQILDKPEAHIYPTNLECVGSDPVFVGRLRRDFSVTSGLNFWIMSDNLRKGAALNALQIMETLYNYRRMA